jgi:hypothetical protein
MLITERLTMSTGQLCKSLTDPWLLYPDLYIIRD